MLHYKVNSLKRRLDEGRGALGCSTDDCRDVTVIRSMAAAGADFCWIDLEHWPMSLETVAVLVDAAEAGGVSPIVRIPELTYENVTRTLELGCQTIIVPQIRTAADVQQAIQWSHYAPIGHRGMGIFYGPASAGYRTVADPAEAAQEINSQILLGLVIETADAIENLDDILIPGVGFVALGFQDLAQDYGLTGQYDHEVIQSAGAKLASACDDRGIHYLVGAGDLSELARLERSRPAFVVHGGVLSFLRKGLSEARSTVDEIRSSTVHELNFVRDRPEEEK